MSKTLRLPVPATTLVNGSPELDAILDGACRRLHLFKTYRDLRAKRARLVRELAATDQELAKCAEPIRLAMLDQGIESVTLAAETVRTAFDRANPDPMPPALSLRAQP